MVQNFCGVVRQVLALKFLTFPTLQHQESSKKDVFQQNLLFPIEELITKKPLDLEGFDKHSITKI